MERTNSERLSWNEIVEKYPEQWLGLTEVEWADNDMANVASAVVAYTGLSSKELLKLMLDSNRRIIARSTPQHKMSVGVVG